MRVHAYICILIFSLHYDCVFFFYIFKLLSTTISVLSYSCEGILYMGGNAYITGCVYRVINKKIKKKKYKNKPVWGKWTVSVANNFLYYPFRSLLNHYNDNSIVIIKYVEMDEWYAQTIINSILNFQPFFLLLSLHNRHGSNNYNVPNPI